MRRHTIDLRITATTFHCNRDLVFGDLAFVQPQAGHAAASEVAIFGSRHLLRRLGAKLSGNDRLPLFFSVLEIR